MRVSSSLSVEVEEIRPRHCESQQCLMVYDGLFPSRQQKHARNVTLLRLVPSMPCDVTVYQYHC